MYEVALSVTSALNARSAGPDSWASTVTGAPTIISTATVGAVHHAREAKSPFIFFETSARVEGHRASDIAAPEPKRASGIAANFSYARVGV